MNRHHPLRPPQAAWQRSTPPPLSPNGRATCCHAGAAAVLPLKLESRLSSPSADVSEPAAASAARRHPRLGDGGRVPAAAGDAVRSGHNRSAGAIPCRSRVKLPLHELIERVRVRGGRGGGAAATGDAAALLTSQIKLTATWREACTLFLEFSDAFNAINVTALVCHLPKVVRPQALPEAERADFAAMVGDLRDVAEQLLPGCRARELANIAHGFASLGLRDRRLMQLLLARFRPAAAREQELANLLWAAAKMGHQPPDAWLDAALASVRERMPRFKPQELATVTWALATLRRRPPAAWLDAVCGAAAARLGEWGAPDVAMLLWALAALRHTPPPGLMVPVALRVCQLEQRLEEQHVGMVLWALARLRDPTQQLQQQQQGRDEPLALQYRTGHQPATTHGQSCAPHVDGGGGAAPAPSGADAAPLQPLSSQHAAHATGSTGVPHSGAPPAPGTAIGLAPSSTASPAPSVVPRGLQLQPLLPTPAAADLQAALGAALLRVAPRMRQPLRNTSTILVACVQLGWRPPGPWVTALMAAAAAALAPVAGRPVPECSAAAAATLLWALVRLGYRPPRALLPALEAAVQAQLAAAEPKEVAVLLWGMAKLWHAPGRGVVHAAVAALASRPHLVGARDVANVLWALARMRVWISARLLGVVLCHFTALVALPPLPAPAGLQDQRQEQAASPLQHEAAAAAESPPAQQQQLQQQKQQQQRLVAWRQHMPRRPWDSAASPTFDMHGQACTHPAAADDPATARYIANVVWSLVHLGRRHHAREHRQLLSQLVVASGRRMGAFAPMELLQVAIGFAALGYHPGCAWMQVFARSCLKLQPCFSEREARQLRLALARLAWLRARGGGGGGAAAQHTWTSVEADPTAQVPERMLLSRDLAALV